MIKKIKKILISRKLAIVLLTLITVLLIIGSLLPKITYLTEREKIALENTHPIEYKLAAYLTPPVLSKSPLFIGLTVALFIIILLCTTTRIFNLSKKQQMRPLILDKFSYEKETTSTNFDKLIEIICGLQGIKGWQKSLERDGLFSSVTAKQKNYRLIGSIIFHVSLLVIITGAFISSLYSLNAGIILTEGQSKAITIVLILLLVILIPTGIYLYKIHSITPEQRVKEYTKGLLKAYQTLDIKDISKYVAKEQYYEDLNQLAGMKKENIVMIAKIDRQVVADKEIKGNQAQVKMSETWTYHFVNATNNKDVEPDRDVLYFITYQLQNDFFKGWQITKTNATSYDLGYTKNNKKLKYNMPNPAKKESSQKSAK